MTGSTVFPFQFTSHCCVCLLIHYTETTHSPETLANDTGGVIYLIIYCRKTSNILYTVLPVAAHLLLWLSHPISLILILYIPFFWITHELQFSFHSTFILLLLLFYCFYFYFLAILSQIAVNTILFTYFTQASMHQTPPVSIPFTQSQFIIPKTAFNAALMTHCQWKGPTCKWCMRCFDKCHNLLCLVLFGRRACE